MLAPWPPIRAISQGLIPLIFYGAKVEEDHQQFIDQTYNILSAMGLTTSRPLSTQRCVPNLVRRMERQ